MFVIKLLSHRTHVMSFVKHSKHLIKLQFLHLVNRLSLLQFIQFLLNIIPVSCLVINDLQIGHLLKYFFLNILIKQS